MKHKEAFLKWLENLEDPNKASLTEAWFACEEFYEEKIKELEKELSEERRRLSMIDFRTYYRCPECGKKMDDPIGHKCKVKVAVLTCPKCNDKIWSKHRHDFVYCKCGEYFIDGGRDYTRVGGENAIDHLSEKEVQPGGSEGDDSEIKPGEPFWLTRIAERNSKIWKKIKDRFKNGKTKRINKT